MKSTVESNTRETRAAPRDGLAIGNRGIRINGVTKIFRTKVGNVTALTDTSFEIESGQFLSIVGPSGCGKSTMLRIVAGLLAPTAGSVDIGGKRVTKPFTDLGIVFQRDLLLESRTALDNILLQVEMRGLNPKRYVDAAHDLLQRVGLDGFSDKYPRELSGGMRQRVGICRALIHDPPVLLMDEPFGALDALSREEIALDLSRLCESSGKTVLFITHSIHEAVFLSDRVIAMTSRPAKIAKDIIIDIPRPRTPAQEQSREFGNYIREIQSLLIRREAT
ncbi:ABC transporter ATP-binding protein [Alcaligenaceae bacterium]|nr:ABC transporter ATP-binding protein [Alcaligenaceae bacterium]